jgi:hypothetical protein
MNIEKEKLSASFDEWEEQLTTYSLPKWDMLPDIDLYMDQVISIIEKYLKIYIKVTGSEKIITSSMINNYVKLSIIPSPNKKKYSRIHLAYLLVICTLKQTLNMATIQKIMPVNLTEQEVMNTYNSFIKNQHKAYMYVVEHTKAVSSPILSYDGENNERINDLVMQVAASANIFKILTDKISDLSINKTETENENEH